MFGGGNGSISGGVRFQQPGDAGAGHNGRSGTGAGERGGVRGYRGGGQRGCDHRKGGL